MSSTFSRRAAIFGAAALPMIGIVKAQTRPKFIAISSANRNNGGVNACAKSPKGIYSSGISTSA